MAADAAKWDEAQALLTKLEMRIATLELKRVQESAPVAASTSSSSSSAPVSDALVEENKELKSKVERLEYRILMLSRALREADAKLNLSPSDMK